MSDRHERGTDAILIHILLCQTSSNADVAGDGVDAEVHWGRIVSDDVIEDAAERGVLKHNTHVIVGTRKTRKRKRRRRRRRNNNSSSNNNNKHNVIHTIQCAFFFFFLNQAEVVAEFSERTPNTPRTLTISSP